jgi:penicillin-binding protein 2
VSERSRLRLAVLRVLVLALLGTLLARLWYLQVMAGDEYRLLAQENQLRTVVEPAPRGRLLDDRGRPLVRNRTSLVVTVDPAKLERQPEKGAAVLARLAKVLPVPLDQLTKMIQPCGKGVTRPCNNGSPYQPVAVFRAEPEEGLPIALTIEEHREDFPGVEAALRPVRFYPYGPAAAHSLGYIGPVSPDELKQPEFDGFAPTDEVGRAGLEEQYDRWLRGTNGQQVVAVNSAGRVTDVVRETPPTTGNDLVLALDVDAQRWTDEVLRTGIEEARRTVDKKVGLLKATSGAIVVMDVRTGQVVAMSSFPTFDPSVFIGGVSTDEYAALTGEGTGAPLTSRATQGQFAPGSTFKIVSTAAAVMNGGAALGGSYPCPGQLKVGNRFKRNFEGRGIRGRISLRTALVKSCDTIYYQFAMNDWFGDENRIDRRQQPAEALNRMARAFGFGRETGIDLPSEQDGRISDRAYKKARWEQSKKFWCEDAKRHPPGTFLQQLQSEKCVDGWRYRLGDHVDLSIGQGETVVTPLQLAVAYSALANGGTVYAPRLAKAVVAPDGRVVERIPPKVMGRLPVSPEVLSYMREALAGVPTEGTAVSAFRGFDHSRLRVAGKTGTAQVANKQDTSWFAAFAPVENPRFAVVAMVEEGSTGGAVAAPMVRRVFEGLYGLNGKPAIFPDGAPPAELPKVMPDGRVQPPGGSAAPVAGGPPSAVRPSSSASPRRRGGLW